jgi:hypothetical protein
MRILDALRAPLNRRFNNEWNEMFCNIKKREKKEKPTKRKGRRVIS